MKTKDQAVEQGTCADIFGAHQFLLDKAAARIDVDLAAALTDVSVVYHT